MYRLSSARQDARSNPADTPDRVATVAPTAHDARRAAAGYTGVAKEWAAPRVEHAREWAAPRVEHAREWAAPRVEHAREWAAPRVEHAREWAGPHVESAREWAGPRVETVERVKEEVIPRIAETVTTALAASEPALHEARARSAAAVAALKGELRQQQQQQRRRRRRRALRWLVLLAAVCGGAYAGWKAWTRQPEEPEPWDRPAVSPLTPVAADATGASPEEAASDAATAEAETGTGPTPVTDPDATATITPQGDVLDTSDRAEGEPEQRP